MRPEGVVEALRRPQLADRICGRARTLLDGGLRVVRVGIDGPVESDAFDLAEAVGSALRSAAVPVARVRARDYLRPRSLRLEHGRDDPDAFYRLWYDTESLRREVLDPLGPKGRGSWLPRLRDPDTDRPWREPARQLTGPMVAVLDGRFLLRGDVRPGLDLTVHLDVSGVARRRRMPPDEAARVLPAWDRYLADCEPAARADFVVRFDHPDRPALVAPR